MNDLISRQAAIDAVKRLHDVALANWKETKISANTMIDALKDLPSAQPEIIRCKDCKYYNPYICLQWSKYGTITTEPEGYCYKAERRSDGR